MVGYIMLHQQLQQGHNLQQMLLKYQVIHTHIIGFTIGQLLQRMMQDVMLRLDNIIALVFQVLYLGKNMTQHHLYNYSVNQVEVH